MFENSSKMKARGFTTIELVTIIIIIGVLAVVALPRFSGTDYRSAEFHDQAVAALRYAQKTATSHRRNVCVFVSANSIALTIGTAPAAICNAINTQLLLPGASSNTLVSPAANANFTSAATNFMFLPNGTVNGGGNQTLSISGQTNIVVVGATGYVN
jgi:MSHA pilin protein MshC